MRFYKRIAKIFTRKFDRVPIFSSLPPIGLRMSNGDVEVRPYAPFFRYTLYTFHTNIKNMVQ